MILKFIIQSSVYYLIVAVTAVSLSSQFKYNIFRKDIVITADRSSANIHIEKHSFKLNFLEDVGNPSECGEFDICLGWGQALGPVLHMNKDRSSKLNMWKLFVHNLSGSTLTIDLKGDNLYGGPVGLQWPGNNNKMKESAYVSGVDDTGAVAERYWFTSGGLAIHVDFDNHLFVSQNSSHLQLSFQNKVPYPATNSSIRLKFCIGETGKDALACFPQKRRMVDHNMIRHPIWSTWVRFKAKVDQQKVMNFAHQIKANGFKISSMEIDDKWETCYGNHEWDKKKFPDAKGMIKELKSQGMYVTLWVHPFVNVECEFFKEAAPYLYKLPNGSIGVTSWWNGQAGLIDFTNKSAHNWFMKRLQALKEDYGLTGFKFDAGEAKYIPGLVKGTTIVSLPNQFTNTYVKMASSFGVMGEVRVGADNIDTPIFQRLQDTDSHWNASMTGLRSIIPTVLTLNSLGYSAILPDMVGGNMYTGQISKELFIRWLQLNTFLPSIQYSVAPWDFDQETVNISRRYTDLHRQFAHIFIKEIEKGKFQDGHRVITPVWWHAPLDNIAQTISDEFLVGTNILVAPIVEDGARMRDIYLPFGNWSDSDGSKSYIGPTVLTNYSVPLEKLPYFIRLSA